MIHIKSVGKNKDSAVIRTDGGDYYFFRITDDIIRAVYTKNSKAAHDSLMIEPSVMEKCKAAEEACQTEIAQGEKTGIEDCISAVSDGAAVGDGMMADGEECKIADTEDVFRFCLGNITVSFSKESGSCRWEKSGSKIPHTNGLENRLLFQEKFKDLTEEDVYLYNTGGEMPVVKKVKTVDGERTFIENLKSVKDRTAYRGRLGFSFQKEEGIYGLGQGEEGIYNYRHHTQYLYQHNMRIPMPFFVSDRNYGVLFNCASLMTFNEEAEDAYMFLDTVDQLDYFIIAGDSMDDVISGYRTITGKAAMLPKWAFGYIQSKEQYYSADELLSIGEKYRSLGVPLDCVVQDWNSWEAGKWGEKKLDKERYGNIREVNDKLHDMNIHTMISVWPNMSEKTENLQDFVKTNHILGDYSTYDAFSEEAREIYWKQAREELFSGGFDAWWCDSTEPFTGKDWNGETKREPWERYYLVGEEHKKYLDAAKVNAFALMHAKGIYENQRKERSDKRVLNLTRSGYASQQKYGVILWSGDISASWQTLSTQITEGLNMALSGMPYWTLDIGAFFVVGTAWQKRGCGNNTNPNKLWFWDGKYNDGVMDKGYCELYTRWLEFGCFLPVFRSHGTDTPREIWNFGEPGSMFYDTIEKFIKLRYRLMPYIYSLAGAVSRDNYTIMRSLIFDFPDDEIARKVSKEYMFGPSLLICPVTEPMYYGVDSAPLTRKKTWECYLPKLDDGCLWHHFWSGDTYVGGQYIIIDAPLGEMPIFVKGGSILPMLSEDIQYAGETPKKPITLHVYPGKDASFTLYEDGGDDYSYEDGDYAETKLSWNEETGELTIGERVGSYKGMQPVCEYEVSLHTL